MTCDNRGKFVIASRVLDSQDYVDKTVYSFVYAESKDELVHDIDEMVNALVIGRNAIYREYLLDINPDAHSQHSEYLQRRRYINKEKYGNLLTENFIYSNPYSISDTSKAEYTVQTVDQWFEENRVN
jgi:hypothetical protein